MRAILLLLTLDWGHQTKELLFANSEVRRRNSYFRVWGQQGAAAAAFGNFYACIRWNQVRLNEKELCCWRFDLAPCLCVEEIWASGVFKGLSMSETGQSTFWWDGVSAQTLDLWWMALESPPALNKLKVKCRRGDTIYRENGKQDVWDEEITAQLDLTNAGFVQLHLNPSRWHNCIGFHLDLSHCCCSLIIRSRDQCSIHMHPKFPRCYQECGISGGRLLPAQTWMVFNTSCLVPKQRHSSSYSSQTLIRNS